MFAQENAFTTEAAALVESLHQTAGLLGSLAEYCRRSYRGGNQLEAQVRAECQQLLAAAATLVAHPFRVAVVGDFDAGKSTLISALAGKQLLPMHPNPATALVTWISHGDIESYSICVGGGAAPRAITGDDFLSFHHSGAAQRGAAMVDHLEARLPFPLLSRGVVLLDTPGFDNGPDDTARTQAILSDCSGLILCTPSVHPLSERDLSLLNGLVFSHAGTASFLPDEVFLVLTFADAGQFEDDPALMGQLLAGLRTRLVGLGGLDGEAADSLLKNRTAAVSGRLALRARLTQNSEDELASGITVLEERLDRFFLNLQQARLLGARSALASAGELGRVVCRSLREESSLRKSHLTRRVVALQQQCEMTCQKLERLDTYLAAFQEDFAEWLPGIISQRMQGVNLGEVANPIRVGLAAITNLVLSRWSANDQVRTARALEKATRELGRVFAKQVFSGLLESERLARIAGMLKTDLLDLFAVPPPTAGAAVVPLYHWPDVVEKAMTGVGGALERRLTTALLEGPSLEQCVKTAPTQLEAVLVRCRMSATWAVMKQAVGSETYDESDERRRRELFSGACEIVGSALRTTDSHRLVKAGVPGLVEELRLHLREPISASLQRWKTELQRTVESLEAERRRALALQPLEDLEAELAHG